MKRYLEWPGVCQKRLSRLCFVTSQLSVPPQHLNWTLGKWTILCPFPEYPFNLAYLAWNTKAKFWQWEKIWGSTLTESIKISCRQLFPAFFLFLTNVHHLAQGGGHIPICNAPSPECYYSLPSCIWVPPEEAPSILGPRLPHSASNSKLMCSRTLVYYEPLATCGWFLANVSTYCCLTWEYTMLVYANVHQTEY